jgi:hypothetical protein
MVPDGSKAWAMTAVMVRLATGDTKVTIPAGRGPCNVTTENRPSLLGR